MLQAVLNWKMQAKETHDSQIQKKIHFPNDAAKFLSRLSPFALFSCYTFNF